MSRHRLQVERGATGPRRARVADGVTARGDASVESAERPVVRRLPSRLHLRDDGGDAERMTGRIVEHPPDILIWLGLRLDGTELDGPHLRGLQVANGPRGGHLLGPARLQ